MIDEENMSMPIMGEQQKNQNDKREKNHSEVVRQRL